MRKNLKTGKEEIIGSYNEYFNNTDEDIEAHIDFVEKKIIKYIFSWPFSWRK